MSIKLLPAAAPGRFVSDDACLATNSRIYGRAPQAAVARSKIEPLEDSYE